MINEIKDYELFSRLNQKDCVGNEPNYMWLLLLATMPYLGRGLIFDDLEEYTFILAEVLKNFFSLFLEYGSTILCNKYVVNPATKLDISAFEKCLRLLDSMAVLVQLMQHMLECFIVLAGHW